MALLRLARVVGCSRIQYKPMSMNLDDAEEQALAREIAAQRALDFEAGQGRATRREVRLVIRRIHALPRLGTAIDHAELLYEEYGLPK